MCVVSCKMTNEVIGAGEQDITDNIVFPEFSVLRLQVFFTGDQANTFKIYVLLNQSLLSFIFLTCTMLDASMTYLCVWIAD